jgi:hypothetical protein
MLTIDLGDGKGGLHLLAPFKVLIVMCYPAPGMHKQREQMLGCIQRETGLCRPRRRPLTAAAFGDAVRSAAPKGMVAGSMLLYMLQLRGNGEPADVSMAFNYVVAQFPPWKQPEGDSRWPNDIALRRPPRSRQNVFAVSRDYRSVAHLWAAALHGLQHDRPDIWPDSHSHLPTFLSYAETFLEMGVGLPAPYRRGRFFLLRREAWRFDLAPMLRQLRALPLPAMTDPGQSWSVTSNFGVTP